jgi:hypothetical protein
VAEATTTAAEAVGFVLSAVTGNAVGDPVFDALSVPQTAKDFAPSVRPASAVSGALDQV